ncbi:MAG: hypothetical protein AAF561_00070 [Planctomycetota bacterium]
MRRGPVGHIPQPLTDAAIASRVPAAEAELAASNQHTKLSPADVVEIVQRRSRGEKTTAIAKRFRVYPSHVSAIARGRSWSTLTQFNLVPKRDRKLTDDEAASVYRRIVVEGEPTQDVAEDLGIHQSEASNIARGKRYRDVSGYAAPAPDPDDRPFTNRSTLTPNKVREIVRRVRAGESHTAVARSYGIRPDQVTMTMRGETHRRITGIEPQPKGDSPSQLSAA